ncbi:MAG: hypothetical protein ACTS5I_01655 [Rhodanobacter sp.]
MKPKILATALSATVLFSFSAAAHAIGREDVLECGLPDGSKFVLRSTYEMSLIPWPLVHASRNSKRQNWRPLYHDVAGKISEVPASVMYRNEEPRELIEVCAHFGMLNGVPLAEFTYLRENGSWLSLEDFPWGKLSVSVGKEQNVLTGKIDIDKLTPTLRAVMDKADIGSSVYLFGLILPKNGRLVYEQPLYKKLRRSVGDSGLRYDLIFDAVYQSFSDDDGKTWSDPIVTTDAQIFEMDKSWLEQSFIAKPIRIDGKDFKTYCSPTDPKECNKP